MSKFAYIPFSKVEVGKSYEVVNGAWDFFVEYKTHNEVLISYYSHIGYHTAVFPVDYKGFDLRLKR